MVVGVNIRFDVFNTAQKIKFSIKHFFSKCEQIRREDLDGATLIDR